MDPEKIRAALEAIKNGDADAALALLEELVASAAGADEAPADEAPPAEEALAEMPEPPEEDEDKMMARALRKLTGRTSAGEAIEALTTLAKRVDALDAERAKLDLSARRELIANLVQLGVELPATAWAGKPENRTPVARLMSEPLDDLRVRVALLSKTRPAPIARPTVTTLTDREQALAAKMTTAQKERFEALRASRRSSV